MEFLSTIGDTLKPVLPVIIAAVVLLIIFFVIRRVTRLYHKVAPNQAMIIFGLGKSRTISGGGAFVFPLFQESQKLDLSVMSITAQKDLVYSTDGVPVLLDWVAQVQIDNNEESLQTAARAFLGKQPAEVKTIITETLSTNFRAIIGAMTVIDVHRDREQFSQKVQELAADEMQNMGVTVVSMGVKEITDKQGYFEALAQPEIAKVKKEARIATAEANKAASQIELDTKRAIVEQTKAVDLEGVKSTRAVGLAQAEADIEVQEKNAIAEEKKQEVQKVVPARANKQALTIEAEGKAEATKTTAEAEAQKIQQIGEAEASSNKAKLLAEAEGQKELAKAIASEGEVNLRRDIAKIMADADVKKIEYLAMALGSIGENVKLVDLGSGGTGNNKLVNMLMQIPELVEIFNAKSTALHDMNIAQIMEKVGGYIEKVTQPADTKNTETVESKKKAPKDTKSTQSDENKKA